MKDISKKIKPLSDRVIIKEDNDAVERKTSSGIIIPVNVNSEDKGGKTGAVIAVGPGRTEEGKVVALSVKVGDKVLFQWGDKIKIDNEEYYVVRESEIMAIIK